MPWGYLLKMQRMLWLLFILNLMILMIDIYLYCQSIFFFFQLTIIGQILVTLNFLLSIILENKNFDTKLLLSRLHLITLSIQSIVVVGYWGLRIFFTKGILKQGQQRDLLMQLISFWVHGGSFLTMFYFIRHQKIVLQTSKKKKFSMHLIGLGMPFIILQFLHWKLSGEHVYGFLQHLDWFQIIVFQAMLYLFGVMIDYFLSIRHGYKLSLKHIHND